MNAQPYGVKWFEAIYLGEENPEYSGLMRLDILVYDVDMGRLDMKKNQSMNERLLEKMREKKMMGKDAVIRRYWWIRY